MSSFSFKNVVFLSKYWLIWFVSEISVKLYSTYQSTMMERFPLSNCVTWKKNHIKLDKAILDLNFLLNCKTLGAVPKFLCFNLPYTNHNDPKAIRRRLLRSAIRKRTNEKYKLTKDLQESTKDVKSVVTRIEWLVLEKLILMN